MAPEKKAEGPSVFIIFILSTIRAMRQEESKRGAEVPRETQGESSGNPRLFEGQVTSLDFQVEDILRGFVIT